MGNMVCVTKPSKDPGRQALVSESEAASRSRGTGRSIPDSFVSCDKHVTQTLWQVAAATVPTAAATVQQADEAFADTVIEAPYIVLTSSGGAEPSRQVLPQPGR